MKMIWTAVAVTVAIAYGTTLAFVEFQQPYGARSTDAPVSVAHQTAFENAFVRASGLVKGRTEEIELRARLDEEISDVRVARGQWVDKGTVLVCLNSKSLSHERDLAEALLAVELATKDRLENGLRPSERDTYRREYEASLARYEHAEKSYARGVQLMESQALSHQSLDDLFSELEATRALAAAAKQRFETAQMPARDDELMAANGAVRAAQTRLKIAQLKLEYTQIVAPIDGQILSIEAEVGELTGPQSEEPLIVISDTKQLRVVAEIDEFDALRVQCGQLVDIHSDASEGIVASGRLTEIEPRMEPKRLLGQWAGERTDTSALRVWIDLQEAPTLPIGLPVDVFIHVH